MNSAFRGNSPADARRSPPSTDRTTTPKAPRRNTRTPAPDPVPALPSSGARRTGTTAAEKTQHHQQRIPLPPRQPKLREVHLILATRRRLEPNLRLLPRMRANLSHIPLHHVAVLDEGGRRGPCARPHRPLRPGDRPQPEHRAARLAEDLRPAARRLQPPARLESPGRPGARPGAPARPSRLPGGGEAPGRPRARNRSARVDPRLLAAARRARRGAEPRRRGRRPRGGRL